MRSRLRYHLRPLRPKCTGPGQVGPGAPSPSAWLTPGDVELRQQQTTGACPFLRVGATDGGNLRLGSRKGTSYYHAYYCPKWELEGEADNGFKLAQVQVVNLQHLLFCCLKTAQYPPGVPEPVAGPGDEILSFPKSSSVTVSGLQESAHKFGTGCQ